MKFLIFTLLIIAVVSGCGPNRNELMTRLIDKKKFHESQMKFYHDKERAWKFDADPLIHGFANIDKYKPMRDSARKYGMLAYDCQSAIAKIDFSIDSLLKMK